MTELKSHSTPWAMYLVVPGVPVAQPRQRNRAFIVNGKAVSHNYTPRTDPVQLYKASIRLAAEQAGLPPTPWDAPISLHVVFYHPRPKRLMRKRDPDGPIPHIVKPDNDNSIKAVKDALNGILWRDDCLIWDESVRKFYHEKGGRPRTEITAIVTAQIGA